MRIITGGKNRGRKTGAKSKMTWAASDVEVYEIEVSRDEFIKRMARVINGLLEIDEIIQSRDHALNGAAGAIESEAA